MVIVRRLKDTFQYTHPYDGVRSQQRIMGRRIFSTKKLLCLPFNQSWNMNFNEISHSSTLLPSIITEKRMINDHQYDVKQSKLKNVLIDELKSFFISRNVSSSQTQINHERIQTTNKSKS
jgi:predicted phosphohydrolase